VQGAGGMRFYSADYLKAVRSLCDEFNVLLIADEIATGFGRTGKLFACEHAQIAPDILCLGKALTGGYMTLSAVLTTAEISREISQGEPGVFMHGPTFMANPLACKIAKTSIDILLKSDWQKKVAKIENPLNKILKKCEKLKGVKEVRILGAIGVVELENQINLQKATKEFVDAGVWIRPFLNLIYIMPPFIIKQKELKILTNTIYTTIKKLGAGREVPKSIDEN